MAARTSYAGTASPGDVYTAANHAKMPGGWIGYKEITANQTGITSATAVTGLSETVEVGTGRRIRITCRVDAQSGSAPTRTFLYIKESTTTLARGAVVHGTASVADTLQFSVILTPSSGEHTYHIEAEGVGGTSTIVAASTLPAYILVEDLGPSS